MNVNINAIDGMDGLMWTNNGNGSQGFAYSPFGSTAARRGGDSLLSGFNGERLDPVSQTYHLGNGYRTYNPTLMRFNAPDSWSPFGAGGLNQYVYCDGDPINRSDPSGHMNWEGDLGIVVSALGILGDILTLGAAIPATAAACAAFSVWDGVDAIASSFDVIANATGIASNLTQESDPEASQVLGWVSLATYMVSFTASTANSLHEKFSGRSASYDLSSDGNQRQDGCADSSIGKSSSDYDRSISNEQSRAGGDREHSPPVHREQAGVEGRTPHRDSVNGPAHYADQTVLNDHSPGRAVFKGQMGEDVMSAGRYRRNFDLFNFPDNISGLAKGGMWIGYFATYIAGKTTMQSNPRAGWILQQSSGAMYLGAFGLDTIGRVHSTMSHSRKMARWKKMR